MWIEIRVTIFGGAICTESSPAGDVDWNRHRIKIEVMQWGVISCGRCGLKFSAMPARPLKGSSHLLREMWIEISILVISDFLQNRVISCGRCGLKYNRKKTMLRYGQSHLLREMWIEIPGLRGLTITAAESSPAGDVDWNWLCHIRLVDALRVISCGRCGLKSGDICQEFPVIRVISCGRCGLKLRKAINNQSGSSESSPAGDVDWNS